MMLQLRDADKPVAAVLFDLDDTLVRTQIDYGALKRAAIEMADAAGARGHDADKLDALSVVRIACEQIEEKGGDPAPFRQAAFVRFESIEEAGCKAAEPIRGAQEWTKALTRDGVKVGIVTRNCRRIALELLDAAQIACDALLSRDDVPATKPDPAHLWAALNTLGAPASEAIMVGDHWMDAVAGKAAGCLATVGVLGSRDASWFDLSVPDFLVRDLAEAHRRLGPSRQRT